MDKFTKDTDVPPLADIMPYLNEEAKKQLKLWVQTLIQGI